MRVCVNIVRQDLEKQSPKFVGTFYYEELAVIPIVGDLLTVTGTTYRVTRRNVWMHMLRVREQMQQVVDLLVEYHDEAERITP